MWRYRSAIEKKFAETEKKATSLVAIVIKLVADVT